MDIENGGLAAMFASMARDNMDYLGRLDNQEDEFLNVLAEDWDELLDYIQHSYKMGAYNRGKARIRLLMKHGRVQDPMIEEAQDG